MTAPKLPNPTAFDPAKNWPEPDMSLLHPVRPPAPLLSPGEVQWIFGPWASWLQTAARIKGAPLDYVALGLLVAASSLIGNARWVSPWNGWEEPPVLWGMLVGDPSAGKSPALDAIMKPLSEIERALADTFNAALGEWEAKNQIAKIVSAEWRDSAKKAVKNGTAPPEIPVTADAGSAPLRERTHVIDTTTEKMAELMAQTHRSLLSFRDELSGWLGGMDRYSDGGDRPFWLEGYGGRAFAVDRKSSPHPIIVDRLSIAVLGGIQPDKLDALLRKTADDGLLARFLVVFPHPLPVSRPTETMDAQILKTAFERLRALPSAQDDAGRPKPWLLSFEEAAATEMQSFREQCQTWGEDAEGLFAGHIGKLPGLVARVACVLTHLDWAARSGGSAPSLLTVDHVRRSRHLVAEHFRLHAQRAYGFEAVSPEARNARKMATLIFDERPPRLKAREIQNRNLKGLDTAQAIHAALGYLAELGWVQKDTVATGGRPSQTYLINPRIWSAPSLPQDPTDPQTKADKSPPTNLLSGSVPLSVELPPLPPLPPVLPDKTPEK